MHGDRIDSTEGFCLRWRAASEELRDLDFLSNTEQWDPLIAVIVLMTPFVLERVMMLPSLKTCGKEQVRHYSCKAACSIRQLMFRLYISGFQQVCHHLPIICCSLAIWWHVSPSLAWCWSLSSEALALALQHRLPLAFMIGYIFFFFGAKVVFSAMTFLSKVNDGSAVVG